MKMYQLTEFDCGPITVYNALNHLFPRNVISPILEKKIMALSMDNVETTRKSMKKIAKIIPKYMNAITIYLKKNM